MKNNHTEEELNLIILDHLDNCEDYKNVCELKQTDIGKQRIITRIKELIFKDGIADAETAIALVDNEIGWAKLQE